MTTIQNADPAENTARAVRGEDSFDVAAVDRVLKEHIGGLEGTPAVGQFSGGASNLTYSLDYEGRSLILRRPPHGVKPASGHSMIREYTAIKSLKPVFPSVPDALYYVDTENSVLGAEFYVMERVDGLLLGNSVPDDWGWTAKDNTKFCRIFWEKLIELHSVDYNAAGLSDFGKPEGYVARQVGGWNKRFEAALTPDVHPFEDVREWLADNQPVDTEKSSVLHGDFRIDNMILNRTNRFQIDAVLDWELCTLGDPLMDLGGALAYWIQDGDPDGFKALEKQPSRAPGMLRRSEIVALYSEKTGIKVDDFTFYYVFGLFRLAVIAQQIYRRYHAGQTTNPAFKGLGQASQGLCFYCQYLVREGMGS
ncbi:MAG: phosphotransferase family protein [Pseudomonadota bacterium]